MLLRTSLGTRRCHLVVSGLYSLVSVALEGEKVEEKAEKIWKAREPNISLPIGHWKQRHGNFRSSKWPRWPEPKRDAFQVAQ